MVVNNKKRKLKCAEATVGGTSAVAASNNQMTPLGTGKIYVNDHRTTRELYLFPQELTETKGATSVIAQTKQTKKHYENQNDIGDKDRDNARFAAVVRIDCHTGQ
jgi:hypothetical protein